MSQIPSTTAAYAEEAVQQLGLEAEIVKVDNPLEIAQFKVMFTPGLAIDGKVKCAGKVPSVEQITTWLSED